MHMHVYYKWGTTPTVSTLHLHSHDTQNTRDTHSAPHLHDTVHARSAPAYLCSHVYSLHSLAHLDPRLSFQANPSLSPVFAGTTQGSGLFGVGQSWTGYSGGSLALALTLGVECSRGPFLTLCGPEQLPLHWLSWARLSSSCRGCSWPRSALPTQPLGPFCVCLLTNNMIIPWTLAGVGSVSKLNPAQGSQTATPHGGRGVTHMWWTLPCHPDSGASAPSPLVSRCLAHSILPSRSPEHTCDIVIYFCWKNHHPYVSQFPRVPTACRPLAPDVLRFQ